MISTTLEAIEGREWPRTEAEIHLLRSAMFTAQAIVRDMERAGREEEIGQISRNISEVAPGIAGANRRRTCGTTLIRNMAMREIWVCIHVV